MLLDLKNIFVSDGAGLDFNYELDLSGYELSDGEFPFRQPVRVSGRVENRAGVVTLKAVAKYAFFTRCDRCCREYTEQDETRFENTLVVSVSGEGGDDFLTVENDQLELDGLVVSNIILDLPMKHLCSGDCEGLCPVCGKNLNEGPC